MYENGRRVKGYQRKRLHKRKVKQAYAKGWVYGEGMAVWNEMVIQYKDEKPTKWGHPLNYWKDYSRSDLRTHAKKQTNKAVRREFTNQHSKILLSDGEDFPRLTKGDYRRYYDYAWTVW